MEKKLEKKCNVDEFKVGSKYRCLHNTFYVTNIDYERGHVFITWNKCNTEGLIYLNTIFSAYEVPISSLEKELL
jgi:hypothetical protein